MENIVKAQAALQQGTNLSNTANEVQKVVYKLQAARQQIIDNPESSALVLAKLKAPVKASLDKAHSTLKEIYSAQSKYGRVLDKKFKAGPFPDADFEDAVSEKTDLIDQAVFMHLLREGDFELANKFARESEARDPEELPNADGAPRLPFGFRFPLRGRDESVEPLDPGSLGQTFTHMYEILDAMEQEHDLRPAIQWARAHSHLLAERGSTFEFDLEKLWFTHLVQSPGGSSVSQQYGPYVHGILQAIHYARNEWGRYMKTNGEEIQQLLGSVAFAPNPQSSPYAALYSDPLAWQKIQTAFSREYCSLLGLSAKSPLYVAATAGSIALPTLLKYKHINRTKKTEWTSLGEAPVEVPLPKGFVFHSIYVCPVSKEQCNEANPPMLLKCGHMISRASLKILSKNSRFKCHYCPVESHPDEARRVYL